MIFHVIPDLCIWVLNTRKNRIILFLLYYCCYTIILASATLAVETKPNTKNTEMDLGDIKKLLIKTTDVPDMANFDDEEYPEYEDYLNKSGKISLLFITIFYIDNKSHENLFPFFFLLIYFTFSTISGLFFVW